METMTIRIRQYDWLRLRRIFKSYKGETASSYIFRLAEYLEERRIEHAR